MIVSRLYSRSHEPVEFRAMMMERSTGAALAIALPNANADYVDTRGTEKQPGHDARPRNSGQPDPVRSSDTTILIKKL
jgi:hypothetical protein